MGLDDLLDGDGESDEKLIYRRIDTITDKEILNEMKDMRRNIPRSIRSRYNFAYAKVDIEGITKTKFYSHSTIKNLESINNLTLTTEQKQKLKDISLEPSEINRKFDTLNVNEKYSGWRWCME